MLVRRRLSRIFYRRRFFDYPLKLNAGTLRNMGIVGDAARRLELRAGATLRRSSRKLLEDFLVNRFGDRLYRTFFKDYTEKVGACPARKSPPHGVRSGSRDLSVTKALAHALDEPVSLLGGHRQKQTETSLIERFLYPKFGPGQMWEEVARDRGARRRGPSCGIESSASNATAYVSPPSWCATRYRNRSAALRAITSSRRCRFAILPPCSCPRTSASRRSRTGFPIAIS